MSTLVRANEIIDSDGTTVAGGPTNCPLCGAHPQQGPEKERWLAHFHCWKCGYQPGGVVSASSQQEQYVLLKNLVASAVAEAMNSPQQKAIEALAAKLGPQGMADLQAQEQARLQGSDAPPSGVPIDTTATG